MALKPLSDAIPNFKRNEERADKFINGREDEDWITSNGETVPTMRKLVKRIGDDANALQVTIRQEADDNQQSIRDEADQLIADVIEEVDNILPEVRDSVARAEAFGPLTFASPEAFFASDIVDSSLSGKVAGSQASGQAWEVTENPSTLVHPVTGANILILSGGKTITPEACGAKGGVSDDTVALQLWADAIYNDGYSGEAHGTYHIEDTLTLQAGYPGLNTKAERAFYGLSRRSRIILHQINKRGVVLKGRGLDLPSLHVEYASPQGSDEVNSWGICYRGLTMSRIGFQRSDNSCKNGLDTEWNPSPDNDNVFFSNDFGIVWIRKYGKFGYFVGSNSRYSSGCTFGHIYIDGTFADGSSGAYDTLEQTGEIRKVRAGADFAIRFERMPGAVIQNLNIERASAGTLGLLSVAQSTGVRVNHLHFEGVMLGANYAGLIRTNSGALGIGSLDIVDTNLGVAHTLAGAPVGKSVVGGRIFTCSKYDFGYAVGDISVEQLRFGGKLRAAADTVVANSQLPKAVSINKWSDETVSLDGSSWDWENPPNLANAALIDTLGYPKTTAAPYVGGPTVFSPVSRWDGKDVIPYAKGVGGGGTQTAVGVISLSDSQDRWGLHAGGVFTAPEKATYRVGYRVMCQYEGAASVTLRRNGSATVDTFSLTRSAGVSPAAELIPRYSTMQLDQGDTIALYLESGGVAKGPTDTWCEILRLT